MNNRFNTKAKSTFRDGKSEHYTVLCRKLGYTFKNKTLLQRALTRKTAIIDGLQSVETGTYQRLEFLGDNVIGLAVSELLFTAYPNYQEGQLTLLKSEYVQNDSLAKIAKRLGLGEFLIMGKSDKLNGVRQNIKALADTVESLFGAIFIDCGRDYSIIRELVEKHWAILGLGKTERITANNNMIHKTQSTKSSKSCEICFVQDEIDKALVKAVKYGTASEVEKALQAGASPHVAHEEREEYTVGDNLCWTNPWVVSVLELALVASEDSYQKTAHLLKYGADPNWNKGYIVVDETPTPFSRELSVSELMKFKTKRIYHQSTALHTVASSIDEIKAPKQLIALLLQYDANHNAVDWKGRTPIALLRQQLKQFDAEKEKLYKYVLSYQKRHQHHYQNESQSEKDEQTESKKSKEKEPNDESNQIINAIRITDELWLQDDERLKKIAKLKMVIEFLENKTIKKLPTAIFINLMSQASHSTIADTTDMTFSDASGFGSQIMHSIFSQNKIELSPESPSDDENSGVEKSDKTKRETNFKF